MAAAEAAASLTAGLILNPERAARLVEHSSRDGASPRLPDVIDALIRATWEAEPSGLEYHNEIRRSVSYVVLYHLMALAADEQASAQVRAVAAYKLDFLKRRLENVYSPSAFFATQQIERFQRDPKSIPLPKPAEPPPGQPIGME